MAQSETANEKKHEYCDNNGYAKRCAVLHHESKSGVTVTDRKDAFDKIAEPSTDQNRHDERPQRYLKDPLRQHK